MHMKKLIVYAFIDIKHPELLIEYRFLTAVYIFER